MRGASVGAGAGAASAVSVTAGVWVTGVGWDTVGLEVAPGNWKPSTVAAHVSGVAADEPLWAEYNVDLLLDAVAVAKSLGGTESPT